MFAAMGLLKYRAFGYGHSFGVLSHYYGREAGLELREDIDTVIQVSIYNIYNIYTIYTDYLLSTAGHGDLHGAYDHDT